MRDRERKVRSGCGAVRMLAFFVAGAGVAGVGKSAFLAVASRFAVLPRGVLR